MVTKFTMTFEYKPSSCCQKKLAKQLNNLQ